jgi:glutaredoxin
MRVRMQEIILNVAMLSVLIGSVGQADTLTLRNGKTFDGEIYEFTDSLIRIKTPTGNNLVFKASAVQDVLSEDTSESKSAMIQEIKARIAELAQNARPRGYAANPDQGRRQKYTAPEYDWVPKSEPQEEQESSNLKKKPRRQKRVEVYMTPDCPYCQKMMRFLKEKRIRFNAYDISRSKIAQEKYKRFGSGAVPVTVIDGRIPITGFEPGRVMHLLNN